MIDIRTLQRELGSYIKFLAIAVVLMILVRSFIFSPYEVRGESMSPNLQSENKLIVSKFTELISYNRFDIIVFDAPDADARYVKRIIGLPGDTVKMIEDVLYVNGKAYEESYLKKKPQQEGVLYTQNFTLSELTGYETVPNGQIFVLGDNRSVSKDGRYFGFIPEEKIIGKAILTYWPLRKLSEPNL